MATPVLGREVSATTVAHPEQLRGPMGTLTLIDDPLADRLGKGDPTFGWEGDPRYALYVNYRLGRWELWRLEGDGEYRHEVAVPGHVKGVDAVGWLVNWIVTHDTRRGFDPHLHIVTHNTRVQRQREADRTARNEEFADRFHHALMKDLGPTEVGLSRRIH